MLNSILGNQASDLYIRSYDEYSINIVQGGSINEIFDWLLNAPPRRLYAARIQCGILQFDALGS